MQSERDREEKRQFVNASILISRSPSRRSADFANGLDVGVFHVLRARDFESVELAIRLFRANPPNFEASDACFLIFCLVISLNLMCVFLTMTSLDLS